MKAIVYIYIQSYQSCIVDFSIFNSIFTYPTNCFFIGNSANISSPAAALAHRRTSAGNKPIEMKNLDSFRNEFSQDVQVLSSNLGLYL